jgi:MOSC domain-containing protein
MVDVRVEIGRIAAMWRYPIKSLQGEALTTARIGTDGIEGDRERAFIIKSGHARTGRTYRGKENDRLHLVTEPDDARKLAESRAVEVLLDASQGRYFDGAPISLLLDIWLDDLRAYLGYDVEPMRFRPSFFVTAAENFVLKETGLVGREIGVGDVQLTVREPIDRCVVTTYDPAGGPSDPEILGYVARERGNMMGIYCDVLRAGTVRAGDPVELIER